MNIHFISGLPRSGSTLLAAILNQNPDFKASIVSPVAPIVTRLLNQMSMQHETSIFIDDDKRRRLVKSVFDVFYFDEQSIYDQVTVFDSNRAWCAKLPLLTSLFPDCKMICCVRDVPWIFDSVERFVRRNCFQPSALFNYAAGGTVYSRCEQLAAPDGMIGFALNALREACYGEQRSHIMLLDYQSLVANPIAAMEEIYHFIGAQPFKHDFFDVYIDAIAFDAHIGAPGLHAVRREVSYKQRESILPPDLYQRYANLSFWVDGIPDVLIV